MALPDKTTFPEEALRRSKQEFPPAGEQFTGISTIFTAMLANVGNRITPWGLSQKLRDQQLREFWPTEPFLAGALYGVSIRNASFEWEIEGPTKLETALTDMLNGAIAGSDFGWMPFITKTSQDFLSQDNGMFVELIRDPTVDVASKFKDEKAPIIGIAHLDANRCQRTGNPKTPVIYQDRQEKQHKLRWWEVMMVNDYPSAIETMNGVGYSCVTRTLIMAQIMYSISTFKDEKIGGRFFQQIHLISGPAKQEILDVMAGDEEKADNEGLLRFIKPAIVVSLDPEKPISKETIELAGLPDGFEFDTDLKWYITNIALNAGIDYQDLAPLPTGNIGSGEQSEILHRKSRGKGPAYWMELMQTNFSNYGIIPKPAKLVFKVKDVAEEMEQAEMRTKIAEEAAILVRSGIMTPKEVRERLVRHNIFDEEDLPPVEDDFGMDIIKPGNQQLRGTDGGNTIEEDAQRVSRGRGILGKLRRNADN